MPGFILCHPPARMRVGLRPSSPDQSLTLPELRPTFGRKLLDRERGSARHCGLNLLAHLSLGRSGTPLRGGGVLFRHAASLSGMSQLTACAISTSQGTRSGSGRGMRPSANALASSMRFWGKVQGAGRSLLTRQNPSRRPHASSPGLENRRGMIAESPVIAGADFYPLKPASAASVSGLRSRAPSSTRRHC